MLQKAIAESQMTKAVEDSKRAQYIPPGQPTNAQAYPEPGSLNHAEPSRTESEIAPDKGAGENDSNSKVL